MTSLRFALGLVLLVLASCSDDAKPEAPRADGSLTEVGSDAASDVPATMVCPRDAGAKVGCEIIGSTVSTSGVIEEVRWENCAEGKVYSIACGPAGSDGLSDCTCKVSGVPSGTFRAVVPTEPLSKAWGEVSACYCGVTP